MSYYDDLRKWQEQEEVMQFRNDMAIHKYFVGSLKPSNKSIIRKYKEEAKRWNVTLKESTVDHAQ